MHLHTENGGHTLTHTHTHAQRTANGRRILRDIFNAWHVWYLFDHSWTNYINIWFIGFPHIVSSIVHRLSLWGPRVMDALSHCTWDESDSTFPLCDLIAISCSALRKTQHYKAIKYGIMGSAINSMCIYFEL